MAPRSPAPCAGAREQIGKAFGDGFVVRQGDEAPRPDAERGALVASAHARARGGRERRAGSGRAGRPLTCRHAGRAHPALQGTIGNRAVGRLLQREPQYAVPDTPSTPPETKKIEGWDAPLNLPYPWELGPKGDATTFPPDPIEFVFIMGAEDDKALNSAIRFYTRETDPLLGRVLTPTDFEPTFTGIFAYLSRVTWPIKKITIVSHGGASGVMYFGVDKDDKDKKTSPEELRAVVRSGRLPKLDPRAITSETEIRLKACFVGNNQEVTELWDEAFGEGIATVTAAKVKIAYNSQALVKEGLTGWWIATADPIDRATLAARLKAKYGASVTLDEMLHTSGPRAGQPMSEDEKWAELAAKAEDHVTKTPTGTVHTYIAASVVQLPQQKYEEDPTLYSKSTYQYSPTEL